MSWATGYHVVATVPAEGAGCGEPEVANSPGYQWRVSRGRFSIEHGSLLDVNVKVGIMCHALVLPVANVS